MTDLVYDWQYDGIAGTVHPNLTYKIVSISDKGEDVIAHCRSLSYVEDITKALNLVKVIRGLLDD